MGTYLNEPIAIIGSGCRFPGGATSPSKLWKLLHQPYDLSKRIPDSRYNPDTFFHDDGEHHGTSNVDKAYFLEEDISLFDASFFNIAPREAETIDPQQRLLLETVYEGLESAGLSMQELYGSKTSVYVGCMTMDYYDMQYRDPQLSSQYVATGTAASILANRVSYFFDWKGPSMTIDTACSSSLVAVHQAVHSLRSGESKLACAAGSNLILGPERFIAQSSLHMLSPTGKSRMWDSDADGYARGEGIACVFLKTLSQAIADGDHIEALVRETGVNSDGRTKGITMPSAEAQAELIRDTYARAGLNALGGTDRCQYFEAHGTGTQAGDPQEARAISSSFFAIEDPSKSSEQDEKLLVGSIKTVIGHTEGAAGIAGLLKIILAMQNKTVPPNQHLETLNPSVAPFYTNLRIPTALTPWPVLAKGSPMRASLNSFGFGGTNAHAIIESYELDIQGLAKWTLQSESSETVLARRTTPSVPLLLSAASEKVLRANVEDYIAHLKQNESIDFADLLWTHWSRRSTMPVKAFFSGTTTNEIVADMQSQLAKVRNQKGFDLGTRLKLSSTQGRAKILGIFTGQGAQWPTMGSALIQTCDSFAKTMRRLEDSLRELPDPPSWSLTEEITASVAKSRLHEAALSQPLCTALQVALVDLLAASGIRFHTVVGHSSGEIAAAYAAGHITATDAVRIAYYRGVHAKLAKGNAGRQGAMIAVGFGMDEAEQFCEQPYLRGRIGIAASNSSNSVTLSGDDKAVHEAKAQLDGEGKFSRVLKVDTAYHSFHMNDCSTAYQESLKNCGIKASPANEECRWFSTVYGSEGSPDSSELEVSYWRDNMVKPVLFSQAVSRACSQNGPFDVALEVGPHPALKAPVLQILKELISSNVPYVGTLDRTKKDYTAFGEALGFVWAHLGGSAVDFQRYEAACANGDVRHTHLKNLPAYHWDHSQSFWRMYRVNRQFLNRPVRPHELLGIRASDDTENDMRWRNIIKPDEILWLQGHRFQGQIIVPAAAYCVMAFEASKALAAGDPIQMIELRDVVISSAITIEEDSQGIETLFSMQRKQNSNDADRTEVNVFEAQFMLQSAPSDSNRSLKTGLSGRAIVYLGEPSPYILPNKETVDSELRDVDLDEFYTSMNDIGLTYTGPFRSLTTAQRRMCMATATMQKPNEFDTTGLPISPALLDSCLQAGFIAFAAPGDMSLWTPFLPQKISRMRFNLFNCETKPQRTVSLDIEAYTTNFQPTTSREAARITSNIEVFNEKGEMEIQLEGVTVASFSKGSKADDRELYLHTVWDTDVSSGLVAIERDASKINEDKKVAAACETLAYQYLRTYRSVRKAQRLSESAQALLEIFDRCPNQQDMEKDLVRATASKRNYDLAGLQNVPVDLQVLRLIGENLSVISQHQTKLANLGLDRSLVEHYFGRALGSTWLDAQLARTVQQIAHRHARMNVLELSSGYNSKAQLITDRLGTSFASYTYTTVHSSMISQATQHLSELNRKVSIKSLNLNEDLEDQGFTDATFDLVLVCNSLHHADSFDNGLGAIRSLLRPGGYILLAEPTSPRPHIGLILCGLASLWPEESIRNRFGLGRAPVAWDKALCDAGFSGIDAMLLDTNEIMTHSSSLIVSQATTGVVQKLRRPLYSRDVSSTPGLLLLIGGRHLQTTRIIRELSGWLLSWEDRIIEVQSLEELDFDILPEVDIALCLADLDEPVLKDMNPTRLMNLQKLFAHLNDMLWITCCALENNPYHSAMWGLGRCVWGESSNLRLQFLDIEKYEDAAATIAQALLRLKLSRTNDFLADDVLWTIERETVCIGGKLMIPRLFPDDPRNMRLNSRRRVIEKTASSTTSVISLSVYEVAGSPKFSLRQGPPANPPTLWSNQRPKIKVHQSTALPIQVAKDTFLYLIVGTIVGSSSKVLAYSKENASYVTVPTDWHIPVNAPFEADGHILGRACRYILSKTLLESAPAGLVVLCEADILLSIIIEGLCARTGRKVLNFTRNEEASLTNDTWAFIHPQATERSIKTSIPQSAAMMLDFTQTGRSDRASLVDFAPAGCIRKSVSTMFSFEPVVSPLLSSEAFQASLLASVESFGISFVKDVETITVGNLISTCPSELPFSLVDWSRSPSITLTLAEVDTTGLFSASKTYFLVGLAGELGESICRWMFAKGARYFVISSRNPKKNMNWVRELNSMGGDIRVEPMDVSCRQDVVRVYQNIIQSMPPISGVINGAMVLSDGLFATMSTESFEVVMKPKAEGSAILDDVFGSTKLDFFVMLSSLSCIVGNPGQSNYSAANMFMAGLAGQRRKRGLPASVLDIGMMIGIGFVRRSGQEATIYGNLRRQGYLVESEQDFHDSLAEAILASHDGDPQIITGLDRLPLSASGRIYKWYSEPKFSHHIIDTDFTVDKKLTGIATTALQQVRSASSPEQAIELLQNALGAQMELTLGLSSGTLDPKTPIVDLGVDSLVAVEIRTWVFKEVDQDLPVLRILGGASLFDICQELGPKIQSVGPDTTKLPVPAKPAATLQPAEPILPFVKTRPSEAVSFSRTPAILESTSDSSPNSTLAYSDTMTTEAKTPPSGMDDGEEKSIEWHTLLFDVIEDLSFGQRRFWSGKTVLEGSIDNNVTIAYRLKGQMSVSRFERAVGLALQKHAIFRSSFYFDIVTKQPVQGVSHHSRFWLKQVRCTDESECINMEIRRVSNHVFDIQNGDTFIATLLVHDVHNHTIVFNYHNIIMDGFSWQLFLGDISHLYNLNMAQTPAPKPYTDFVAEQRKWLAMEAVQKSREFWVLELNNAPTILPMLPFSLTDTRKVQNCSRVIEHACYLEKGLATQIKQSSAQSHSTNFHFYLATLQTLLMHFLDVEDICIGVTDAGRSDQRYIDTVGLFTDYLPMRFLLQKSQPFVDILRNTKNKVYAALSNAIPFDIIREDLGATPSSSHHPLFQVMINYRLGSLKAKSIGDVELEYYNHIESKLPFDFVLTIDDIDEGRSALSLSMQEHMFDGNGLDILLSKYIQLLEVFSKDLSLTLETISNH